MTFYPQCRITWKGKDRLHARLETFLIINAAFVYATASVAGREQPVERGDMVNCFCRYLNINVRLPLHGPLQAALAGKSPDRIAIECEEIISRPQYTGVGEWAGGFGSSRGISFGFAATIANMISPIFVEFYESYRQAVFATYQGQDNWPEVWRFARVVRNGLSHGGCISIERATERPARWYGLTYSHANNGHRFIGVLDADMSLGDFLVLMFEMDDVLADISCLL